jgi:spore coat polysaccharide biosynthesis protein SpsF (cytidylyltransferase family)
MKIVGIVQARTTSSRLPGKVLLDVMGKPLIIQMLERIRRCALINDIWLATSDEKEDDFLSNMVKNHGYNVFRGSLTNVLGRFWHLAKREKADVVVRLTGDCPLHDPEVIDAVIECFMQNRRKADYVSNVLPSTYPDGLDTEVFSFSALDKAYHNATSPFDLEHVTVYIRKKAIKTGKIQNFYGPADFSNLRWTVDEMDDLELIREVYRDLYPENKEFGWLDVVAWQTQEPRRLRINSMHKRSRLFESVRIDDD